MLSIKAEADPVVEQLSVTMTATKVLQKALHRFTSCHTKRSKSMATTA
jgi:hypothetical protein